jgi:hypothetical protein
MEAIISAVDQRLDELRDAAVRFRQAIERCDQKQLTVCMANFPRGSCGDATLLLRTYLAAQGLGSFVYVVAERPHRGLNSSQSHAWLESRPLLVKRRPEPGLGVLPNPFKRLRPAVSSKTNGCGRT